MLFIILNATGLAKSDLWNVHLLLSNPLLLCLYSVGNSDRKTTTAGNVVPDTRVQSKESEDCVSANLTAQLKHAEDTVKVKVESGTVFSVRAGHNVYIDQHSDCTFYIHGYYIMTDETSAGKKDNITL